MKKNHPDDHDGIRQAAQEAVEAARTCGVTILHNALKKRSKRTPSDKKVNSHFQAWVKSGEFLEFSVEQIIKTLRRYEISLGKPSKEWSPKERREAYCIVKDYFISLAESCNRPRGRPRKQKNVRGIIANIKANIVSVNSVSLRKKEKEHTKEIVEKYFRWERGIKQGLCAGREWNYYIREGHTESEADQKVGTLAAFIKYASDGDISMDKVLSIRLSKGWIRKFMATHGIPSQRESAFRMRISRERQKRRQP